MTGDNEATSTEALEENLKAIREYETGELIIHWEQMKTEFPDDRPWTAEENASADDFGTWLAALVVRLLLAGQQVAADQLKAQMADSCSRLFEIVFDKVAVATAQMDSPQEPMH
jgi:hypothetical protein